MNHANRPESHNGLNNSDYIASVACVVPPYSADQDFAAELVKKHYAPQLNARSLGLIRATFSHPGIQKRHFAVRDAIGVPEEQLLATRATLAEYGNMSSPTVWFVLDELQRQGISAGQWCVMVAYGAGLSAHACLLRKA